MSYETNINENEENALPELKLENPERITISHINKALLEINLFY